jgi:DNA-binding NarL/FixJ family response regulator
MKIRDIVTEAPGALASIKQGYDAGYDAVSKVLNPKRWGEEERSTGKANEPINKLNLRDAVNLAAAGKTIYLKDQQALKQAYAQIKSGEFETRQDSAALLPALKAASDLQKLSPQQQQILSAFAKSL